MFPVTEEELSNDMTCPARTYITNCTTDIRPVCKMIFKKTKCGTFERWVILILIKYCTLHMSGFPL